MDYHSITHRVAPQVGASLNLRDTPKYSSEPCIWSADDSYPGLLLNWLQQAAEPAPAALSSVRDYLGT